MDQPAAEAVEAPEVDVRCPNGYRTMLRIRGDRIEVACRSCRDEARRGGEKVFQVLHHFTLDGQFIETYVMVPPV